ncbi:aspartate racemase [Agaricicola taiwanensis]|uniref:Aspartate racemase n=1 Tax=Agaricicola taiwanensis TaxID=591372 RepID=A0A8J2YHY4_9RHOB|nr:aspartate/glutamate racemase family protein [Agaricicola taiwanensis]GGE44114.1 aspartate racemase [Agaricicola taiwanensis]
MKTIGIIGGMSCESTALYYKRLNDRARDVLGGLHSADILLWSVDFDIVARMQNEGRWDEAGEYLAGIAERLERAGADMILLATNTMHKVADVIAATVDIPFLHIADATAHAIRATGCARPGLIATRFTMEQDFYTGRLRDYHSFDVLVPGEEDRAEIHRIIYDQLCQGIVTEGSRSAFETMAARLVAEGADCLILGCTEVGLLLNAGNVSVPVFDTTEIHADAALAAALDDNLRRSAAE